MGERSEDEGERGGERAAENEAGLVQGALKLECKILDEKVVFKKTKRKSKRGPSV